MVLSREEIQTYDRDGSLVVRGVLTPEEVDDLRTAAEHFEAQAQLLDASSPVIELDDIASRASGEQRIRRIKSPGSVDAEVTPPLVLEPGDISIHHVRLLHGSGPNRSGDQRRLLLQGYAAADAWPIMAQHQPSDWPEWDDRILRGEPTTHARLDGSPVRVPLPLTAALGLFDTQRLTKSSHFASGPSRQVGSR
jgi:hypothetical protein